MNTFLALLLLQTFTQKPEFRDGKIEFTASATTDCAVAVVDAQGRIVRHLAAGVLGPNAPEPLRQNSLAQSLGWDRKDDLGQPATGGPFTARVSLGLNPAFGRFIGHNPAALGSIRGLACGPGGELYILHVFGQLHPNDGSLQVSVFDRQGKYLRTILPFPAGLGNGLKQVNQLPFIYQAETRSLLPGAGDLPSQRPVVTKSGRLAFVGIQEVERYARPGIAQVLAIEKDGSMPPGGPLRTKLAAQSGTAASLALSPDEQTLYATGLGEGGTLDGTPTNAVYAFGWKDPAPRVLVKGPLTLPRCVATARDGTLYVADQGNHRIAAFTPDGKPAGAIAVERPERVEVHPATGAIYVLGRPDLQPPPEVRLAQVREAFGGPHAPVLQARALHRRTGARRVGRTAGPLGGDLAGSVREVHAPPHRRSRNVCGAGRRRQGPRAQRRRGERTLVR
jgi:hypothetical protein